MDPNRETSCPKVRSGVKTPPQKQARFLNFDSVYHQSIGCYLMDFGFSCQENSWDDCPFSEVEELWPVIGFCGDLSQQDDL